MNADTIATIIADYLRDRDDIASADISGPKGNVVVWIDVKTQGGTRLAITVGPA